MGREAVCTCDWAGTVGEVRALLESNELILRGDIRKRVAFQKIKGVKAESDCLCFAVGGEKVQLVLGASVARNGPRRLPARLRPWRESLALRKRLLYARSGTLTTKTSRQRWQRRRAFHPKAPI